MVGAVAVLADTLVRVGVLQATPMVGTVVMLGTVV